MVCPRSAVNRRRISALLNVVTTPRAPTSMQNAGPPHETARASVDTPSDRVEASQR